jgi:hypothetical protein
MDEPKKKGLWSGTTTKHLLWYSFFFRSSLVSKSCLRLASSPFFHLNWLENFFVAKIIALLRFRTTVYSCTSTLLPIS